MIYTTFDKNDVEIELDVELLFHPYFDGGRDEPSEEAWVEIGDILLHDVEVSDQLGNDVIRDIFDHVQTLHPDD